MKNLSSASKQREIEGALLFYPLAGQKLHIAP